VHHNPKKGKIVNTFPTKDGTSMYQLDFPLSNMTTLKLWTVLHSGWRKPQDPFSWLKAALKDFEAFPEGTKASA
jgi:hypothetical protein